jgi:hypothetical protein
VSSPAASVAGSRRPSNVATQVPFIAGSRRPSNASSPAISDVATQGSIVTGSRRPSHASSQESNIIDPFFSAVGISPERSTRTARSKSNSASSVFYGEGGGTNLIEQFVNSSATRTPAKKKNQVWIQNKEHY